ncbi:hypothetical protein HMPREF0972_01794 [Actinomyces sp. oral taxon 848 str. F0332]|nr:hypothetical protein HMPREF0972_01794 [Actinomyces sp. oral taxon 848 str. F0332]
MCIHGIPKVLQTTLRPQWYISRARRTRVHAGTIQTPNGNTYGFQH